MITEASSDRDIQIIESLAKEIWTEHYTPIIGKAQVDYMLDKFQSRQAVKEQIREGFTYFLIYAADQCIGYASIQPKDRELFLSKIYVRSSHRGRGCGRECNNCIERITAEKGLGKITLTVNKNNTGSIKAYEKLGFRNMGSVVQEIGGGFVMDDYKMEKIV
jgi:ribosomal protein S18 acetylase RimI-like enzyme